MKREEMTPKVIITISFIVISVCIGMLFLFKGLLSIGVPIPEKEPVEIQSVIGAHKDEKVESN